MALNTKLTGGVTEPKISEEPPKYLSLILLLTGVAWVLLLFDTVQEYITITKAFIQLYVTWDISQNNVYQYWLLGDIDELIWCILCTGILFLGIKRKVIDPIIQQKWSEFKLTPALLLVGIMLLSRIYYFSTMLLLLALALIKIADISANSPVKRTEDIWTDISPYLRPIGVVMGISLAVWFGYRIKYIITTILDYMEGNMNQWTTYEKITLILNISLPLIIATLFAITYLRSTLIPAIKTNNWTKIRDTTFKFAGYQIPTILVWGLIIIMFYVGGIAEWIAILGVAVGYWCPKTIEPQANQEKSFSISVGKQIATFILVAGFIVWIWILITQLYNLLRIGDNLYMLYAIYEGYYPLAAEMIRSTAWLGIQTAVTLILLFFWIKPLFAKSRKAMDMSLMVPQTPEGKKKFPPILIPGIILLPFEGGWGLWILFLTGCLLWYYAPTDPQTKLDREEIWQKVIPIAKAAGIAASWLILGIALMYLVYNLRFQYVFAVSAVLEGFQTSYSLYDLWYILQLPIGGFVVYFFWSRPRFTKHLILHDWFAIKWVPVIVASSILFITGYPYVIQLLFLSTAIITALGPRAKISMEN